MQLDREITTCPLEQLDSDALDALAHLRRRWLLEHWPEATISDIADLRREVRTQPRERGQAWLVWKHRAPEGVIAHMTIDRFREATAEWGFYVVPEARDAGVDLQLLDRARRYTGSSGVENLLWWGSSALPSLEALITRLSPELLQRTYTFEGVIDELDLSELETRRRLEPNSPVCIEICEEYPADDLRDIARLKLSIADTYGHQPKLLEEVVARLAGAQDSRRARRLGQLTVLAREISTATVVGLAQVAWRESNPSVLGGWSLAVAVAYRGLGLGRALSATLVLEAKKRVPKAKTIRMEMQETARALHERNQQLGFSLHHTDSLWMVRRESIERFLANAQALPT